MKPISLSRASNVPMYISSLNVPKRPLTSLHDRDD